MSRRFRSVLRVATRGAACALVLAAGAAPAAPPALPGQHSYQGVLLDDQGLPQTGNVDLTLRVYDSPTGGTLLYKQIFLGVPLDSGVFTVTLGPTGSATDTPTNPLTTSLAGALAGDLSGTGPSRFLQVTVGSEGALARTQILSVPYALRSASAESADVATTALEASSVGGFSSVVVTEVLESVDLSTDGLPFDHPGEGLGDTDGDGAANFVDADNDDDGLEDLTELGQGSDINLVTPQLFGVAPTSGIVAATTTVTVSGNNFEPGLAVVFGSQSPVPQNLTPLSFEVDVGPQAAGPKNIQVTRLNGQTGILANAFSFVFTSDPLPLTLEGGTPLTATATQRTAVSGNDNYAVDLDADGVPEGPLFPFADPQSGQLAVGFDPTSTLVGIRCRDAGFPNCNVEINRDSDADFNLADETGVFLEQLGVSTGKIMTPSLVFDPSGRTVAAYVKINPSSFAVVAHDRNGDLDFADGNERVELGLVTVNTRAEAAVDPSGRVALAYSVGGGVPQIRVAWDRSGDGDYADTVGGNPESLVLAPNPGGVPVCLGAGFAPDGDLAVVFDTGSGPTLARDLNADGDFVDAGEVTVLAGPGTACDAHGGGAAPLAIAYAAGGSLQLLVDRNDDADFADANEVVPLDDGVSPARIAVARSQTGKTFVATAIPNQIYVDPSP